ncbi:MAG: Hpt domain-containing protein [Zoogloeaceae bacterium]|jgi:chemosensory pili system protein ChpA (sensor histidine kinase/response regulator)|nr:Hpt domain-containing protein [Zoogloeaceae bacterium]
MNAVTDFDLGPLTWVKGEINLALERATEALAQFRAQGDVVQLKLCRTHLHQVHGALSMVGLQGVAQVTEALEALPSCLERQGSADAAALDAIQRAILVLQQYLDGLLVGEPNQPLRLFLTYQALMRAQGKTANPADLFFPDLSVRPPQREVEVIAPEARLARIHAERNRFQRGMLAWLRQPAGSAASRNGLCVMQEAVRNIEAMQTSASVRGFWRGALGLMTALVHEANPRGDARYLCVRIDLQIRRLLEGNPGVAERLLRDTLYFIAQSAGDADPLLAELQTTYRLKSLLPTTAQVQAASSASPESVLRRFKENIANAEEQWNRFCAGSVSSLKAFVDKTHGMVQLAEQLGNADLRLLTESLYSVADWLASQPAQQSEGMAMEIATALILIQNAQEHFNRLGQDFPQQVRLMAARLSDCAKGIPLSSDAVPLLDEISRRAQDRLLMAQVVREIQNNLTQIEQSLDAYFRDPATMTLDFKTLEEDLHQVSGALTMLGHDAAVAYLDACKKCILAFGQAETLETKAFEDVAQRLSVMGFFVEALQNGPVDFQSYVQQLLKPAGTAEETDAETEETPAVSVERQMERLKTETRRLLEAFRTNPDDAGLRDSLQAHLQTLQKDADLVADQALVSQVKAALATLREENLAQTRISQMADEFLVPTSFQPEVQTPSEKTLQLAHSSDDAVDAELLEVFLEEAQEVLGSIAERLESLRQQPHDLDILTTIRRGSHTLKGSGRMVGLKELGEVAWAVEQTLNLWLNQKQEASPELLDMIARSHQVFSEWVEHLNAHDGLVPDYAPVVDMARHLCGGNTDIKLGKPVSTPAEPPPTPEPDRGELVAGTSIDELLAPVDLDLGASEVPAETGNVTEADAALETGPAHDTVTEAENLPEPSGSTEAMLDTEAFPVEEDAVTEEIVLEEAAPVDDGIAEEAGVRTEEESSASVADTVVFDAGDFAFPATSAPDTTSPVEEEAATPKPEFAEAARMPEVSPQLFQIFQGEAQTYMDRLHGFVKELERDPRMSTPFESHRAAHTLAGIAGTLGFNAIHDVSHALEMALVRRDDSIQPESVEGREILYQTVDTLADMLAQLGVGRMPTNEPALIEALSQMYPPRFEDGGNAGNEKTGDAKNTVAADFAVNDTLEISGEEEAVSRAPAVSALPAAGSLLGDALEFDLLPIFLEEAADLLNGLYAQITAWRDEPENDAPPQALARLLHTFKGSARMTGAMKLGQFTHEVESRVSELSGNPVAPADLDEIEAACDMMAQVVESYQAGRYEISGALAPTDAAPVPEISVPEEDTVSETELEEPTQEEVMSGETESAPAPASSPEQPDETAKPQSATGGQHPEGDARAQLRVRADLVDRLVNEAGEMAISRAHIEGEMRDLKESLHNLTDNVIRLRNQLREIEIQAETQIQAGADATKAEFDPLELDRFTRFQELTRMMAESVNDVSTVQQNLLKNLDDANAAIVAQARLNRSLQQSLMSVRMVPFESQSERLYRLVRQISREVGKRARLEIQGGQVELDRFVLEQIFSPLEHMIRNAVAHGLESETERATQGKPPVGKITLALSQESNEIILALSDDGMGLDLQRIREKAEKSGLIQPGTQLEDSRLPEFIFRSGFSTAQQVSQVAGRGIGMDVVKTGVTALGGRVEVLTEAGKGTTFRLYLPLTLAVTQTVLVRAGGRLHAIPSAMIDQVMEIRETVLTEIRNKDEAIWQSHHYPFHYLPHLLGEYAAQLEQRSLYWILLLRSGNQRVSILVDDLIGNQEVVVKNVGPQVARVVGIAGATVLGDGQIALILNPVALASRAPTMIVQKSEDDAVVVEPVVVQRQPTVLVVDDSLTVRKITQKLLTREGYQVELAKDGVDAMEHLVDLVPDIILSDIEMPRMDGFDLVRHIRADERLDKVPVIMITSRTAEKHRAYAMEIGASHYLGKPYDESELLRLLAEYTGRVYAAA